jgi:hypothetical protein
MTSRRRFVLKTSLAAAAMIAARPMKMLASVSSGFQRLAGNQKLVLLHTGKLGASLSQSPLALIQRISAEKNVLLLNVSRNDDASRDYDVVLKKMIAEKKDYLIVNTKGIKTGVLIALKGDPGIISKLDQASTWLKKEMNCHLVVCISELGYKNDRGIDERELASSTSMLDVVISADPKNQFTQMLTARNRIGGEVIIQPLGHKTPVGAIELEFDAEGQKNRLLMVKGLPGSHAA